jgi:hypothetical protein
MVRGAVLALGTRDDRCAADREVPLQRVRRANHEHVAHTARYGVLQDERRRGRDYADASQGARYAGRILAGRTAPRKVTDLLSIRGLT